MDAVVAFALKHRVLMVVLFVMMLTGGIMAFRELNIEAYPDPTPPMVDVITQSPGLSAEEIERYITIPIETQTSGLRGLTSIRTISLYGLSDVKLQFSFDLPMSRRCSRCSTGSRKSRPCRIMRSRRSRRSARSVKSSDIGWSVLPATACSISRPCRTGCCNAASARCPASSTSSAGAARPRRSSSRSISTSSSPTG